ncbi:MAG: nucleotidyltransferase domain-containing protein [Candidatus Omnitrophica bacterium]|nr:nucleotidyltransferase domain-containing protein [Candidatus Omnitrophota bacterium]
MKLFLFNPEDRFYQRQIAALTNQPIRAVQREVAKLEKIGLLERSEQGNHIHYKANKQCLIFGELKRILFKTEGIAKALKESLQDTDAVIVALIYGSYAKGEESASSDIDLLVIGTIGLKELSKILSGPKRELNREINYAVLNLEEFKKRLRQKDPFLTSITKGDKIFIVGSEDELKKIIRAK